MKGLKGFVSKAVATAKIFVLTSALGVSAAYATPVTGTPSANPSFGAYCCNPANTNLFNSENDLHHVLLNDFGAGFVELNFVNPTDFTAYFEYRADGESSQYGDIYPHPTIVGDFYYFYLSVAANSSALQTFNVSEYIEVRSAFGPERDYDFDWTRFDAATAVPAPAALPILIGGLGALGLLIRRRRAGVKAN